MNVKFLFYKSHIAFIYGLPPVGDEISAHFMPKIYHPYLRISFKRQNKQMKPL